MEAFIILFVNLFLLYLLLGLLFAVAFIWKGVGKVDPKASQTSWFFKLLILPGSVAFWPLFLKKWIAKTKRS